MCETSHYEHKIEALFNNLADAYKALNDVSYILGAYGAVSVSDFYDITDPSLGIYDDNSKSYGWTNITEVRVSYGPMGWCLQMPKPQKLFTSKQDKDESDDMVNHPNHYISETGLEAIDVIEAFTFDLKGIEATDTGNVIKYICRWKNKNGVQDLKKATWYLQHLIDHIEKTEKENV